MVVDAAGANNSSAKILEDLFVAGKESLRDGGLELGSAYTSGI